jgi:hypothetical protein
MAVATVSWAIVGSASAHAAAVEVVRDGLSSLQTTAPARSNSTVWVARGLPAALGRSDGRHLRWTPLPLTAGLDGVHLSSARGAVWFVGGQTVGRVVEASGAMQTVATTTAFAANEFSAVAAAPDGSAWVLEHDAVMHHVGDGLDARFAVFANEGGPMAVGRDGRLWFGERPGVRTGGVGILDASGRHERIALPSQTTVSALLPVGADGMLVATADGHLLAYRSDRRVADVRQPGALGALARDRRGRLWATRFSAWRLYGDQPRARRPGFVRLDSHLRARQTLLLPVPFGDDAVGGLGSALTSLSLGPGDSLWSVAPNGTALTRLTTRARDCRVVLFVGLVPARARRVAAARGCRLRAIGHGAVVADQSSEPGDVRPAGTKITVRLANRPLPRCTLPHGALVIARGAGGAVVATGETLLAGRYVGCAGIHHRAVRLAFTDSSDGSGSSDTLSAFQLRGHVAVAERNSAMSHYGDSSRGLVAFDLRSGRRLAAITVGFQLHSQPELTLGEYRVNAAGDLLYTLITTDPDGNRGQRLILAHGTRAVSLASGPPGSITGLTLTETIAAWTQAGQAYTARLGDLSLESRRDSDA